MIFPPVLLIWICVTKSFIIEIIASRLHDSGALQPFSVFLILVVELSKHVCDPLAALPIAQHLVAQVLD